MHLLLPQLAGLERTGHQLAHATWWLPLGVLALEAASFAAYGELTGTILGARGPRPSRWLLQRTTIVGASLGKTLPGGTTTALALIVRALVANRVDPARAVAALAASGMVSSATLAMLLPVAAVLALLSGQGGGVALGAAAAAFVVALAGTAVPALVRSPERLGHWAQRGVTAVARGPLAGRMDPLAARAAVERGAATVRGLTGNRRAPGVRALLAARDLPREGSGLVLAIVAELADAGGARAELRAREGRGLAAVIALQPTATSVRV